MSAIPKEGRILQQDLTGRIYKFSIELASRKDMSLFVDGEKVKNPYNSIQKTNPEKRLSEIDAQLLVTENQSLRRDLQKMREEFVGARGDDKLQELEQQNTELRKELELLRKRAQQARPFTKAEKAAAAKAQAQANVGVDRMEELELSLDDDV